MAIGLLILEIHLPGCHSLKEKRSRIKPLLARLRREFNVSVAEMDHQDAWQSAALGCAYLSNNRTLTFQALQAIPRWVEHNWPDVLVIDHHIEIL